MLSSGGRFAALRTQSYGRSSNELLKFKDSLPFSQPAGNYPVKFLRLKVAHGALCHLDRFGDPQTDQQLKLLSLPVSTVSERFLIPVTSTSI